MTDARLGFETERQVIEDRATYAIKAVEARLQAQFDAKMQEFAEQMKVRTISLMACLLSKHYYKTRRTATASPPPIPPRPHTNSQDYSQHRKLPPVASNIDRQSLVPPKFSQSPLPRPLRSAQPPPIPPRPPPIPPRPPARSHTPHTSQGVPMHASVRMDLDDEPQPQTPNRPDETAWPSYWAEGPTGSRAKKAKRPVPRITSNTVRVHYYEEPVSTRQLKFKKTFDLRWQDPAVPDEVRDQPNSRSRLPGYPEEVRAMLRNPDLDEEERRSLNTGARLMSSFINHALGGGYAYNLDGSPNWSKNKKTSSEKAKFTAIIRRDPAAIRNDITVRSKVKAESVQLTSLSESQSRNVA